MADRGERIMIISHVQQGSDEWYAERAGKVTASCFDKIITSKGAQTASATRATYLYQLAEERITGNVERGFARHGWSEARVGRRSKAVF